MSNKKIINSIKADTTDYGKYLKINAEGDIEFANFIYEYTPILSGTEDLAQDTVATFIYNIADFVGTGLTNSLIRILHISTTSRSYTRSSYNSIITATYPDGTVVNINKMYSSGNDGETTINTFVADIPINSDTTSITLTISENIDGAEFEILGATMIGFE